MNVKIVEVGPRDGLQNESQTLTLEQKVQFIKLLADAGHTHIEAGAFVRADKIPQMADSKELLMRLPKSKKIKFWSLVPNEHGFKEAFLSLTFPILPFSQRPVKLLIKKI